MALPHPVQNMRAFNGPVEHSVHLLVYGRAAKTWAIVMKYRAV